MMEKLKKKHSFYLILILFAAGILLLPMFCSPYIENDDTWFHLMNIGLIRNGIEKNFWQGFTMHILPFVGNNLGYGTRLFYPPLAHTLGAYLAYFLEFFGVGILESFKVFHFLEMALSGLVMYFCSYRFSKDKFQSFVASVIYMASSYHMSEIYVRDALGESLIFIFLPLVITSVKELLEGNKNYFYPMFLIGYVGGILSHFTMMIYLTLILGISMLFFYKKIFKKEFIIPFLIGCLFVFLLTAFFFEPMIEHKLFGKYMVYKKWYMSLGIWHTTLWGFEYLINLPNEPVSFRFSIITIFLLGYVFLKKKDVLKEKYKLPLLFLGISFLMSTRLFFPWLIFPYMLFMIQFGWRLVSFVVFGVALISAEGIKNIKGKWLQSVLIIGILLSGMYIQENHRKNLNLDEINYAAIMGWQQEYLPEKIGDNEENKRYFENRNQEILVKDNLGEITIIENNVPYLKFEVKTEEKVEIELPRIYYLGYTLKNEAEMKINLKENERGFLSAEVEEGTYELDYEGTIAHKICQIISLTTFGFLMIFLLYYFIKKKRA